MSSRASSAGRMNGTSSPQKAPTRAISSSSVDSTVRARIDARAAKGDRVREQGLARQRREVLARDPLGATACRDDSEHAHHPAT